jgi:streptomycin 6-kinase
MVEGGSAAGRRAIIQVVIVIPSEFAARTVTREGDAGRVWIERLPGVVAAYLERWGLTPDGPVMHGYVAIVVPVACLGGERAVLKVSWRDGEDFWEARALAAWDGRGAVRVLKHDDPAGVLLLERLDPARSARALAGVEASAVAGQVCRRLAVPAPSGMPRVDDLAARWVDELPRDWERLGRPFPRRWLDAAVESCRELGPGQPDLLLHGDLVFDNILRAEREPWLVIDPDGLVGEPAFEAAPFLTNRWSEMSAQSDLRAAVRARLAAFAESAGVDFERARRWAHVRHVSEAIWCREHQPDAVWFVDALIEVLD